MIRNIIYYSINNSSLIFTDLDPIDMITDARLWILAADFYSEILEYNTGDSAPGFTFQIAFAGTITIAVTLIVKRKRERKN